MAIASDAFVVDGRYEVGEVLGRGGMGEVRRARDRRLQRDVAIKFLRADLAANPDARRRFEEEAHNAARLNHPNVVLVLDTGEHEHRPYLVMECLPGRTLRDEFSDAPLSEATASRIAQDLLAALAAAHAVGVIHRDVSPSNVLLTDTGRAKLADFGIAKAAEATEHTAGHVLGTPGYLAPERLRGAPATAASDVFGLGVTLRKALGDSPISPQFERLLDQMTSEDPGSRPPAEQALAALDGEADTEPVTAALPVTEALSPSGGDTVAVAAMPESTVAAPIVRAPWARRDRGLKLAIVGIASLLGLLLLIGANSDSDGGRTPASDERTVTTTAPPPDTVAPPTTATETVPTAGVQVGVDVGDEDGDDRDNGEPKGNGKGNGKGKGDD